MLVTWYRSDILTNLWVGDRLSIEGGSCVKVALPGAVAGSINHRVEVTFRILINASYCWRGQGASA